ncbi:hypothetical protein EDC65_3603 [Stella humosa]|uniref:Uncharacterized protein n=1 Tax=Stella humosa TaxID=94 RepID=A0A3N1KWD9_9PROT|nr:hypothetical protein [Stella humosa]ROP84254.1 hypothetical protein EDC65_3603 [Stella humosa]BBK33767.1 hypothetical protein STHU_44010 [Stella humosa]
MRDLMNSIHPVPLIVPVAARTDNTAIVSAIIDLLGYDSATLVVVTGTNTDADATFAALLEHSDSDSMGGAEAVADSDLLGTEALAGFAFGDDSECRKIGYIGSKRYLRLTVTPTGNNSGNVYLAGVAILGHPHAAPTANPPA